MTYIDPELDPVLPVFAPNSAVVKCYMFEHQAKQWKMQPILIGGELRGYVDCNYSVNFGNEHQLGTDKCGKNYSAVWAATAAAATPANYVINKQLSEAYVYVITSLIAKLTDRVTALEHERDADKKTIKQLQKKLKLPKEQLAHGGLPIPRVKRRKIKPHE